MSHNCNENKTSTKFSWYHPMPFYRLDPDIDRIRKQNKILANLIVLVEIGHRPVGIRNTHSLEFRFQIEKSPSGCTWDFFQTRRIMETIEIFYVNWKKQDRFTHNTPIWIKTWNSSPYRVETFAWDLYRGRDILVLEATRRSPTKMSCSESARAHRRSIKATFALSLHASIEPEEDELKL